MENQNLNHTNDSIDSNDVNQVYFELTDLDTKEKEGKVQESLEMAEKLLSSLSVGAEEKQTADQHKNPGRLYALLIRLNHRLAKPDRVLELASALPYIKAWDIQEAFESMLLISYAYYRKGNYENCLLLLDQAENEVSKLPQNCQKDAWLRIQTKKALTNRLNQNSHQAVEICRSVLDNSVSNHVALDEMAGLPALADFFRVYGWSLFSADRKNLLQAKEQLKKAEEILKRPEYDGSNGDKGEIYYTCGVVSYLSGQLEEASVFLHQALEAMEAEYGMDSVELCNTLNQLGALYGKQKQQKQAAVVHERSYNIRKKAYGQNNLLTSIALENWLNAQTLLNEKACKDSTSNLDEEDQKIEQQYFDLLAVRKQLYGEDPAANAFWLGQAEHSAAQWMMKHKKTEKPDPKILELFEKASHHYHQSGKYGMEGVCLKNTGLYFSGLNRNDKALVLWQEALPLIQDNFGLNHPAAKETEGLITKSQNLQQDQTQ